MNKLYQETQQNSMINKIQQLQQNVPQEYRNNPKGFIDYLVQSGRISQNKLNQVMQLAQRLGIRL